MEEEDRLATYKAKRDFEKTPEPTGGAAAEFSRFCVQRHAATRLHYDFRLEAAGVLLSWAVPLGPSFNPAVKRLAVHVEDHPVDYLEFEGYIPKGQYGGGTVILWDLGVYQNITAKNGKKLNPVEATEHGHVKFVLAGEKLKGAFALTRMGGPEERNWIMVKVKDDVVDASYDPVRDQPQSIKTGRVNDDITPENSEHWESAPKE